MLKILLALFKDQLGRVADRIDKEIVDKTSNNNSNGSNKK